MDSTPWIWMAVLVVAAAGVLIYYNLLVARKNGVRRAWADVVVYERQKNEVVQALEEPVQQYLAHERELQSKVTALRTGIDELRLDEIAPAAAEAVERDTRRLIDGLRVAVEAYPDLKAVEPITELMRQMGSLQRDVAAAITIFNRAAERLNNAIEQFPGNLVNAATLRYHHQASFTDPAAVASLGFAPELN